MKTPDIIPIAHDRLPRRAKPIPLMLTGALALAACTGKPHTPTSPEITPTSTPPAATKALPPRILEILPPPPPNPLPDGDIGNCAIRSFILSGQGYRTIAVLYSAMPAKGSTPLDVTVDWSDGNITPHKPFENGIPHTYTKPGHYILTAIGLYEKGKATDPIACASYALNITPEGNPSSLSLVPPPTSLPTS